MKEYPIIFSTDMVRAILEGRKTQTRRVINPQPPNKKYKAIYETGDKKWSFDPNPQDATVNDYRIKCPYGKPGDKLWVREVWFDGRLINNKILYKADMPHSLLRNWKSPIHMPRWASRITLEITDIKVERLQKISEEDAIKEGVEKVRGRWGTTGYYDYIKKDKRLNLDWAKDSFKTFWNTLNAKKGYSWNTNPWVWVISFSKLEELKKELSPKHKFNDEMIAEC